MITRFYEKNQFYGEYASSYLASQYEQLISLFRAFERKEPNALSTYFTLHEKQKGDILLREGSSSRNVWLIESGIIRSYTNGLNGEVTTGFYFPGDFVGSNFSRHLHKPSEHNLEVIQSGNMYEITEGKLHHLQQLYPELHIIEKTISTCHSYKVYQHQLSLQQHCATERYLQLMPQHLHSHLHKNIYNTHIASYLGITLPSLSRIKKEISKKRLRNSGGTSSNSPFSLGLYLLLGLLCQDLLVFFGLLPTM
jgi:CRP-like cAMP-binding protein